MIPITAAIVGGTAVGNVPRARSRTLALTFTYVFGLALAYASLGLFAGLTGTLFGVFVMGAASGLVAAPCSAPVMAAVLTWVTATKSGVLGFIYLFVFSLGMCTLLVVVGLFSGSIARLPRAGAWMVWIKRFFALIMFAVAEYYLVQMGLLLI